VLGEARRMARESLCIGNTRQVAIALFAYANDNSEYFPGRVSTSGPQSGYHPHNWADRRNSPPSWDLHQVAESALSAPEILNCPANELPADLAWPHTTGFYETQKAVYAGFYENAWADGSDLVADFAALTPKRIAEIDGAAATPLVADTTLVPWWPQPDGYQLVNYHLTQIDPAYLVGAGADADGFDLKYGVPVGTSDGSVRKERTVRQLYRVNGVDDGLYIPVMD